MGGRTVGGVVLEWHRFSRAQWWRKKKEVLENKKIVERKQRFVDDDDDKWKTGKMEYQQQE